MLSFDGKACHLLPAFLETRELKFLLQLLLHSAFGTIVTDITIRMYDASSLGDVQQTERYFSFNQISNIGFALVSKKIGSNILYCTKFISMLFEILVFLLLKLQNLTAEYSSRRQNYGFDILLLVNCRIFRNLTSNSIKP